MRAAVSSRATASSRLRRADPRETLAMTITLQLRHREELDAVIAAQHRAGAPEYRRWLTPQEFTERFAPAAADSESLRGWLEREGFNVSPSPSRLRIEFSGTVATVERAFGVRMNHYRFRERSVIANESAPLLPMQFAASVAFVRLHTFPLARPVVRLPDANGTSDVMAPQDMYTAYNLKPVFERGINGSSSTIAVVARSDFNLSDVSQFQQQFLAATREPERVFPTGNPGVGAPAGVCQGISDRRKRQECMQGEELEVVLDAEWAGAMAPGASVLVDISDTDIDASLADIVNNHPEAKLITISFSACERLDIADREVFGPMYAQAAAQGQTVMVASGDGGADECQDGRGRGVNILASDANVTAVGGTTLDPGFDGDGNATRYVSEMVWNDIGGATGGGRSTLVQKPAYQMISGVPADGFRDVPDVALLASARSPGYAIVLRGGTVGVGGTSASAPSWAGIAALLNQAAGADGLGVLNIALYGLGEQQYLRGGRAVFHDVTAGDNTVNGVGGFSAGPGYDLVTGLGTPDVDRLTRAFAVPCPGDCDHDGKVTTQEVLTGLHISLGTLPLAQCEAADLNGDGFVSVDELVEATKRAADGC